MAADLRIGPREDAQRRAGRIRAFREELTELEGLGVVALDAGQQERLRLFHEEATASLAARFDVDASEAEKRLSLGMRVASLLGAMALAAAVYFFFYRFWGDLPTAAQVGLLALAPVLAVAGMEVASAMHCPWDAFGERPENLFLPAALVLATAVVPSPGRPRFPPLLRASGLFVLFVALFVVSGWGWASYLPWPAGTVEVVYQDPAPVPV